MDNFGKRLAAIRKEKKLSQAVIAKRLGVGRTAVTEWERGAKVPSVSNLYKLSELLNTSIEYLTGKSDVPYTAEEAHMMDKIENNIPIDQVAAETNITFEGIEMTQDEKEDMLEFVRIIMRKRKRKDP